MEKTNRPERETLFGGEIHQTNHAHEGQSSLAATTLKILSEGKIYMAAKKLKNLDHKGKP